MGTRTHPVSLVVVAAAGLLFAAACRDEPVAAPPGGPEPPAPDPTAVDVDAPPPEPLFESVLVASAGGRILAYAGGPPFRRQVVVPGPDDDPEPTLVGPMCFAGHHRGRFAAAERSETSPATIWAVRDLDGDAIGELRAEVVGRVTEPAGTEPSGCAFLDDGRLVTTGGAAGPTVWAEPFAGPGCPVGPVGPGGTAVRAVAASDAGLWLATDAGLAVVDPTTLPRTPPPDCAPGRAAGDRGDDADAEARVHPYGPGLDPPTALAPGPDGTWYSAHPAQGAIAVHGADGAFRDTLLPGPGTGGSGDGDPRPAGEPHGIAVDGSGTVYYADRGLAPHDRRAAPRGGTVRRIVWRDGAPMPPEVIDAGLTRPDALAVWRLADAP